MLNRKLILAAVLAAITISSTKPIDAVTPTSVFQVCGMGLLTFAVGKLTYHLGSWGYNSLTGANYTPKNKTAALGWSFMAGLMGLVTAAATYGTGTACFDILRPLISSSPLSTTH